MIKFYYFILAIILSQNVFAQEEFVTRWDLATAGSGSTQISFNVGTTGSVDYTWQEVSPGNTSGSGIFSGSTATASNLPQGAVIELSINPSKFSRIIIQEGADKNRLLDVKQWGTTVWTSMNNAFSGCGNLDISAVDLPDLSRVTDFSFMFYKCSSLNGPANIGSWNVSNVQKMYVTFGEASLFNQNIGNWDVSNVTDMTSMLFKASSFNQNVGSWNVSNVKIMGSLFYGASVFNQDISLWNVSAVTNMRTMFLEATSFNQNIGSWNVSNVLDMNDMMYGAIKFDQNLADWARILNQNVSLSVFLDKSGMSSANYDKLLIALNTFGPSGRTMGAGGLQYCSASVDRANLILPVQQGGKGWTITGDQYQCPLPVNLVSFSGKGSGKNQNTLNWITTDEKNFDLFEIQRANDAKFFETIGMIESREQQDTALRNYQFIDENAGSDYYYRLKMIDLDGTFNYSRIISCENPNEKSIVGSFYPNPSTGSSSVDIYASENGEWSLSVIDYTGKIVKKGTYILSKGMNKVDLKITHAGLNSIKFENGKDFEVRKLVSQ